jgi:rhomboid protease GluP
MDLQFPFAVGLMSLSALILLRTAISRRPPGWKSWAAVNIVVLVTGAAALRWLPQWSGLAVAAVFILLVLAPEVLVLAARAFSFRGRMRAEAICTRLASLLHPTARLRFAAAVDAATAHGPIAQKVAALRALARRATPQQQMVVDVQIAVVEGDWNAVLDCIHRADAELRPGLSAWEIRALGETGRLDDMAKAFPKEPMGPVGSDNYFGSLFVLAFGGRPESVRLLLGRKPLLHSRDYWLAIAAKGAAAEAAGGNDAWRGVMAAFAATTQNESFRRAAQRQLAAPDPGGSALSAESIATIDAIEQQLLGQLRRPAPGGRVTALLLVLVVFGFVAEVSNGGSANPETLIKLGALSAPLVRDGAWWRLATTWFLHDGPFHFWLTLYLVLMLGALCETKMGSRRMLAIYCAGGLATSLTALLSMWSGSAAATFVGSVGGVTALLGSEAGGLLRDRSYWRNSSSPGRPKTVARYVLALTAIILFLWMDAAFESHLLPRGLAVYAPSFVLGLVINLFHRPGANGRMMVATQGP